MFDHICRRLLVDSNILNHGSVYSEILCHWQCFNLCGKTFIYCKYLQNIHVFFDMQSKYLEERFSLSIRILVTSSYILLTVSSMKQTRTKVNFWVALLYGCHSVRTESGVESNNRIEYLDFCGRLWCHLHYLYEYCSYRFEVKAVEREKLLSLGWYEDSDLDGSDSRHNHVSWLDFIHYIRFVPVFLFRDIGTETNYLKVLLMLAE